MRHNLNLPEERDQMLRETIIDWIRKSNYHDIKNDAVGMVELIGAHEFVYQLLIEYLAHHGQPFSHQLEWPNFTLQLSMSIWFSEDKATHDLYVLPSDDRFDFTAPELATNGWLQSRGEDLGSGDFKACDRSQRPDQLRFVSSQTRPGTTYCFVPLLHRSEGGIYGIKLMDARSGLRKVLDSVVWKSKSSKTTFKSVLIIPMGFELLTAQMDELVWYIWNEFRAAGHRKSPDGRDAVDGLTMKLGFGSPQVLVSFLKVMLDEGEELHDLIASKARITSDADDVPIPIGVSTTWREKYYSDYREAVLTPAKWARLESDVPRIAEDLCTLIQHRGELKGITLREFMRGEIPDDRVARMLVARRVILRYYALAQSRGLGYKKFIRELGFVAYDEADTTGGRGAIQSDNFKNYLSDLGLKKRFVLSPLDTEGLFKEELDWLKLLSAPS